ncbi:MAG: FAD-dependent oxidoreductase [Sedimentisphaerales bacterium]|nr:FAD-dependent oxidoreductase [Sedimentisphaerales bacterium]
MARESARNIPVVYEVDVVVVGGTVGGVAAAIAAAQSGAKVFLAAPRTYLGEDVCGTYRFWFEPEEIPSSPLAKKIFGEPFSVSRQSGSEPANEIHIPPTPMQVKRILDNALSDANVSFLFGCYATETLCDVEGNLAGIVMVNRSGRQAVKAKVVIDATPRATIARRAGADFAAYPDGERLFNRIVVGGEIRTGDGLLVRKMPAPVLSGNDSMDAVEYAISIPMKDGTFASFAEAEQVARDKTWQQGQLDASEMLFQVPPDRMRGKKSLSDAWAGIEKVGLDAFQPVNIDRLYVLGGCADISRQTMERLLRPLTFIELGARIGEAAADEAKILSEQKEVHVDCTSNKAGEVVEGDVRESLAGVRPTQTSPDSVMQSENFLPVLAEYDVIVIGGGTGGAPAGIAAARQGVKTLVVEYQYGLGGVGTLGMIGRYSGSYLAGFTAEIDKGVTRMGGMSYAPNNRRSLWSGECKMEWYRRELRKAGADIWFGTLGCGSLVENGRVRGVVVAGPFGRSVVLAKIVIDSTGNADIAAAAGAECITTDGSHIAVQGTGLPPRNLGDKYNNTDYTFVDETDTVDAWRAFITARRKFEEAYDISKMIDTRERRRIVGDYVISPLDFLNHRTYPDTVFLTQALFDTHGFTVHPVFMFPVSFHGRFRCYGPYRSLLPKGLEGILVTGLGISAHRDAMAVYRMQPDIQNQGYAAGMAAAMAVKSGKSLRDIDIKTLQKQLVALGNLPEDVLAFEDSFPLSRDDIELAVKNVISRKKEVCTYKSIEKLLVQPQDSLPLLRQAYADSQENKFVYAHVLAMMGDAVGVATLIEALRSQAWDEGWSFKAMGQFGASLSRVDSLVIAMGYTGDKRVLEPILEKIKQLGPQSSFSHHRAVALVLELFADPIAAGPLAELLRKPEMTGYALTDIRNKNVVESPDLEREHTLRELILAKALYRCGDYEKMGENILRQYEQDLRGHYARHAHAVLLKQQ